MGKKLYEKIKIYEQPVSDALREEEEIEVDDMLGLVIGRPLRDTKKEPAVKLMDGARYGFLTLHKKVKQRSRRGTQYQCECKCGGTVMLTKLDIQSRSRMRAGCLGFTCPYGPDEVKAWHNMEFSLWLQLMTLLKHNPEEVANEWGGRIYEGIRIETLTEGFARMYADVQPLVNADKRSWWMHRKNPVLPYALFNVEMSSEPDSLVLGGESRYVSYADTLYSVNELASMYNLPLKDIKRWRRNHLSDKKVMDIIFKEAGDV